MEIKDPNKYSQEQLYSATRDDLRKMLPKDIVLLALRRAIEEDHLLDDTLTRPLGDGSAD